jgi:TonB-dependent SusC/RagA subfamily outer membrane receptor
MNFSKLLKFVFIGLFGLCIAFQAEAQDQKEKKKKQKKEKTEKTVSYLSLADLLRRQPGVLVQGSGSSTKVAIRGGSGPSGADPLYVIDKVPVGNSYSQVAGMVDVNDIGNINVLSGADASQYGTRGNSGVIEITTKKK